ncbi:hypothetical protein BC835DRAFT_680727 [Cytidiella melzeri]|nr:hypothetical protein BC835DRAFT_680727 [Cytidiella melzeri]
MQLVVEQCATLAVVYAIRSSENQIIRASEIIVRLFADSRAKSRRWWTYDLLPAFRSCIKLASVFARHFVVSGYEGINHWSSYAEAASLFHLPAHLTGGRVRRQNEMLVACYQVLVRVCYVVGLLGTRRFMGERTAEWTKETEDDQRRRVFRIGP